MERMKTGQTAQDIFTPTARPKPATPSAPPANTGRPGPGRPQGHEEAWEKVTVVLLARQSVFLDRLAADIRARTGAVVKRAEIIRARADALAESPIDLTAATRRQRSKPRYWPRWATEREAA